ncbi:MAG: hypothetical protein QXQ53_01190 [Candidatus Methanosuratincola sp.]
MNRGQIREEARILLAEVTKSASYFEDSDLNHFINEGIHDICMTGLVYESVSTISVTSGVTAYSLPSDFIRANVVLDPNGNSLTPINPSDLGRYFKAADTTNVTPAYWYVWGNDIYLVPTCAGTGAGNYPLYYYALDSDLASDTSSPNFPTRYHKYLVLFVCYRALMKARQWNDAYGFALEYSKALNVTIDRYVARFPAEFRVSGILPPLTTTATPAQVVSQTQTPSR